MLFSKQLLFDLLVQLKGLLSIAEQSCYKILPSQNGPTDGRGQVIRAVTAYLQGLKVHV